MEVKQIERLDVRGGVVTGAVSSLFRSRTVSQWVAIYSAPKMITATRKSAARIVANGTLFLRLNIGLHRPGAANHRCLRGISDTILQRTQCWGSHGVFAMQSAKAASARGTDQARRRLVAQKP